MESKHIDEWQNCKTSYCNVTCHYFIHHGEGGDSTYVLTTKNPINMSKNLFALTTNPTHACHMYGCRKIFQCA